MGGADGSYFGAHRNGHRAQVHADEGVANVNACVGLDPLHGAGRSEAIPGGGGEGAAAFSWGFTLTISRPYFNATSSSMIMARFKCSQHWAAR